MVPQRLSMRNFLCYREDCPPLDFTGIELACLVGENGHGKSALLDAITWALWGQARSKTDDELIHLGRVDMEVEFEFRQGDVRYRVLRKRRKGTANAPGRTLLEFQVRADESWKPLTGSTVRDTQARIIESVRLDYDTFRNSAFLMQGHADEFTVKSPGERKKVLSDILGLGVYEQYETKAKEARNTRQADARLQDALLQQLRGQIEKEPQYQREKDAFEAELLDLTGSLKEQRGRYENLRQAQHAREALAKQAESAERECAEHTSRAARAGRELQGFEATIARLQAIVARAADIRGRYDALGVARQQESEQATRQGLVMQLGREEMAANTEIERAAAQLRQRIALAEKEVGRLTEATARKHGIAAAREELDRQRTELEQQTAHLAGARDELQEHHNTVGQLQAENRRLRTDMEELKRKLTELASAGAACPICRTELSAQGKQQLEAQYSAQGSELAAQFRANKSTLEAREGRLAVLQADVTRLEEQTRKRQTDLDRRTAALDREQHDASEAAAELPGQQRELDKWTAMLIGADFAHEARRTLTGIGGRIAAVGFDEAALQRARATVKQLAPSEAEYGELQRAEEAERSAQENATRAARDLSEWQAALAVAEGRIAELSARLATMPDQSEQVSKLAASISQLEDSERRLRQALGAAEQNLEHCRTYRRQYVSAEAAQATARGEAQIYDDLVTAFGRRGVQALIIDSVIPEIEEEANRLLARMSNGRMAVTLSTQRATQKNVNVETLDISIADELGTRAYELFSGGEAFRINLALRIALSKLLARRAGAPLPTLIIDEGFGTQDASGRERLMEAIQAVSRDFECLIVITHMDELKDQFDRQIRVEKTPDGSIVTVN